MANNEALVLDTLAINDGVTYTLEQLTMPPPKKRGIWASGADSDGAVLARDPLFENREITARIRVEPQASMNVALDKIGAISDKLEEAERNEGGIALTWTPAQSTRTITFYVLTGEITEVPIVVTGDDAGWLAMAPVIVVTMTCRPFGYGTEVVGTAPAGTLVTSTLPLVTLEAAGVPGDVDAEARLIVTDNATRDRRLMRWGLESRYYPTAAAPGLMLDSDADLTVAGFAGALATRTGAYDPNATGNNVISATIGQQPLAVCGTGNKTHVGTFRVFARVWAVAADIGAVFVRLSWQDGDGPLKANTYVTPPVINAFAEVDLGLITITEKVLGTQRWTGRIEAYSSQVFATLEVDYLYLVPAGEGCGRARATYSYQPGTINGRDAFDPIAAGTALNGRVAHLGGTWATGGGATDFTAFDDPVDATLEGVGRSAVDSSYHTGMRWATLGATNYTNVEVRARTRLRSVVLLANQAITARWVDVNNHVALRLNHAIGPFSGTLAQAWLEVRVAGSVVATTTVQFSREINTWRTLALIVYSSGRAIGFVIDSSGATVATLTLIDTSLATGGALATGKPGMFDFCSSALAPVRDYDDFYVGAPAAEPIACYSGQSLEVRSDETLREDATGVYWGPPPSYRGSGIYVPPAGTRARKTRIAVMARRNDLLELADDQIADSLTAQLNYTPRYLAVPR